MSEHYERRLAIKAPPAEVYEYFIDPERLVRWMGDFALLDARPGGTFSVDINGVLIRGHYIALEPAKRIEIAWGEPGNADMPPGSSRVVIDLVATEDGTLLTLTHSGLAVPEAEKHAVGWPHFLSRLVVCAEGGDPGADPWA